MDLTTAAAGDAVAAPSEFSGPVLVTGVAGFIGFHVAARLVKSGVTVVGLDNINDYYDQRLKHARLSLLGVEGAENPETAISNNPHFTFVFVDVAESSKMNDLFQAHDFSAVVHLAAQAGVRYSLENPSSYVQSNLVGFANVLECCRHHRVKHLLYASSSSVYGGNTKTPFDEADNVDHPVSLYAATKKSNELMAHSYSHLFQLPCTGLRFFTVYGPWGRPDMATATFTKRILEGKPIELFNEGKMLRDFTFIDDVVEGIVRLLCSRLPPKAERDADPSDPSTSTVAPYRVFNIGNSDPVDLATFVATLEDALGAKATTILCPMQPGDVYATAASTKRLHAATGFAPRTELSQGLKAYAAWFREFYGYPS